MKETKEFHAHYDPETSRYQSVYDHSTETAQIIKDRNTFPPLTNIACLAALLHDSGKRCEKWQEYFEQGIRGIRSTKMDHSTAGGQIMEELLPHSCLSVLVQAAIYSHHGLNDCVDLEDDRVLYDERREKADHLPIEECRRHFFEEFDKGEIEKLCALAREDTNKILKGIQEVTDRWGKAYGNRDFYLGMYERLLLSLLVDADRRNTADFMNGKEDSAAVPEKGPRELWKTCSEMIEKKLQSFDGSGEINGYRREISDICLRMASEKGRRYRLTVPTGAGKTLSSLRFAVNYAQKHHKKRVIYVAPFQSIVEQNADEIRKAVGNPEIVLEHHCNIIFEDEKEQKKYDRLTEDWQVPVIVTTAVQFLDTLFSGKMGSVRRMNSLCDSVIIVDEAQAIPVGMTDLFNLAVNFLTEFAETVMVLCTATQPVFDELPKNRLLPAIAMIPEAQAYGEKFRRVRFEDKTAMDAGEMDVEKAAKFIAEQAERYHSVLFVANTKNCAREIFKEVSAISGKNVDVRHLSTSMYPQHRRDVLHTVCENLRIGRRQICISTQLIEAGVDISFPCVIRSFAGLDSLIQAAGRCNRHKEKPEGHVFLIKMCEEAENLTRLRDIRLAQQSMRSVIYQFDTHPEKLNYALDSQKAISLYFRDYYEKYLGKMDYPVTVKGVSTSLVSLLSENRDFAKERKGPVLKQAFKTAGEMFEAIADIGAVTLVVPRDEKAKEYLAALEKAQLPYNEKKKILRGLQLYTVGISKDMEKKIESGIYSIQEGQILVLDTRFYDDNLGVTVEPKPMQDLFC